MPVRMQDLLEDLFKLAGITCRKKPNITQITIRDEIVVEAKIETFPEFVKLYPFARAYYIELQEPKISGIRETFKVKLLGILIKRVNDEWEPRIYTQEQEITSDMTQKLIQYLEKRKQEIFEVVLIIWKIIQSMKA